MPRRPALKLLKQVHFDPQADLKRIAAFAQAWRSQFRPAKVIHTPAYFLEQLKALETAKRLRLYLITRPAEPHPLAIIDGFDPQDVLLLLALAPGNPADVRPFLASPAQRRQLLGQAPAEPAGRGVFPFLLGEPQGMAWLDLESEGLTLALTRWGHLNVLDSAPLLARRLRWLGQRIQQSAE